MNKIKVDQLHKDVPEEWKDQGMRAEIRERAINLGRKIIVLDDDPTGTQTVYDTDVLTVWDYELIKEEMLKDNLIFYILSNSRAFPEEKAILINEGIANNIARVADELSIDVEIISRSDSTLRGHYPVEVETLKSVLKERLNIEFDGEIMVPFFIEGGRVTVNNIHWVKEQEWYIPAGETEFARDSTFGYKSSLLPKWIEEKTMGDFKAEDVVCITLEDIRKGGPEEVYKKLMTVSSRSKIIVNALTYSDMDVFVLGLLKAEEKGKNYIFRTAASFVKVRAGIADKSLLTSADLSGNRSENGGLVVVGSHVDKSTRQLVNLIENTKIFPLELNVMAVLEQTNRSEEINKVYKKAEELIAAGNDVVIYTSRDVIKSDQFLKIGEQVSSALVDVINNINIPPAYFIAKGGITSSDLATKALQVKKAVVAGQILPGVPVWILDNNSIFSNLTYIVFPGNVGKDSSITEVVNMLKKI